MNSILVTGGAGFIGSHTCLLLLENGYVVFILDSFVNSSEKSIERVSLILKKKGIDSRDKIYLVKPLLRKEIYKRGRKSYNFC